MESNDITIDGCVVSRGELREVVRRRLVNAGCLIAQASELAEEVTQEIFGQWGQEDDDDAEG